MIELRVRMRPPLRDLKIFNPRVYARAEAQALNRSRNNAQTEAIKVVAKAMGVPRSRLKKRGRFSVGNPNARSGKFGAMAKGKNANTRRLETAVIARGRPFNVTRWGGKAIKGKGRRVVATQHSAYGRQQVARKTWMLKNRAIVVRQGKSFRGVYGPGTAQQFEKPQVIKRVQQVVIKRFPGHFRSALRYFIARGA